MDSSDSWNNERNLARGSHKESGQDRRQVDKYGNLGKRIDEGRKNQFGKSDERKQGVWNTRTCG